MSSPEIGINQTVGHARCDLDAKYDNVRSFICSKQGNQTIWTKIYNIYLVIKWWSLQYEISPQLIYTNFIFLLFNILHSSNKMHLNT